MEKIFIDFSKCKNSIEMHRELKTKLKFPDYYGENIDALWDCIQDYCDEPMEITVKKPTVQTADVTCEFRWMRKILQRYAEKYSFSKVIFLEDSES